jgi:hypothetical protein
MKYSLSELRDALRKPRRFGREVERLYSGYVQPGEYNPAGSNLLDEDWDNLVILDACRADLFAEVAALPGRTETRISLAGATYEWVPATFTDRILHDTVYVTLNSYYTRLREAVGSEVHALIDVHQAELPASAYDDRFDIPHPSVLTEHAIEAADRYPEKRIIVHHNVPHYPYLGEFGRERFPTASSSLVDAIDAKPGKQLRADVRRGYRENIEIGVEEVRRFHEAVPGKTVVSADHGEMLGDRHRFVPVRDWGHHGGVYNTHLTSVPWHVMPHDRRKPVASDPPDRSAIAGAEGTEANLRRLGYL